MSSDLELAFTGKDIDAARAEKIGLVNDVSLRNLIPAELAKGFGFLQSKPRSALSPVFVTPDEFRAWCAFYLKVSAQSLVVNGKTYPSPMVAATLFQWGNTYGGSGGWLGYALDNYIGVLQSAWAGQVPAEKALEADDEIALYAGEIPPSDYAPAAKDFSL